MNDQKNEPALHVMTTYDPDGNEVVSVCQCWYGRSHVGPAIPGKPLVGAPISAGDLTATPGHETWTVDGGCVCGFPCPSIEYWEAHIQSLARRDDQN